MKPPSERAIDVLRDHPCENMSAREVCEAMGLETAGRAGQRNIRDVANQLCAAVKAGLASMTLANASWPECRYIILEVSR